MSTMSTTTRTEHTEATYSPADLRPAGIAGLLSAALIVTALAVVPADPGGNGAEAIVRRYADGSDGYLRSAVLEILSVTLLVVLVAGAVVRLHRRPGGQLAAAAATIGGGLMAACQLLGYGLIAVLALGTAERGDAAVVIALYDASAVAFVVASAGLAVAGAALGITLLRRPRRHPVVGTVSVLTGALGAVGACALAPSGPLSPHGDVTFLVLVVQLVWTLTVASWLLRRDERQA